MIIRFRRGQLSEWNDANTVLEEGEPGWDKSTRMLKIGDGINGWNNLPYYGGVGPQGLKGDHGINAMLVWDDTAYPERESDAPVIFFGPESPETLGLMQDEDMWLNSDPFTAEEWPTAAQILEALDAPAAAEAAAALATAKAASIPSMPVLATNLMTYPNLTEVTGASTWLPISSTSELRPGDGPDGRHALRIHSGTAGAARIEARRGAFPAGDYIVKIKRKVLAPSISFPPSSGSLQIGDNASAATFAGMTLQPSSVSDWVELVLPFTIPVGGAGDLRLRSYVGDADVLFSDVSITPASESVVPFFNGDTPGARWTGTPHASTSELLMPRSTDMFDIKIGPRSTGQRLVPDLTQSSGWKFSTALYLEGNGSPEGVLAAPVGSTYTDLLATNGAVEWTKFSGTGTTGWRVTKGDTGWRDLVRWSGGVVNFGVLPAGFTMNTSGTGWIRVRRLNNVVRYGLGGLNFISGAGTLISLPVGFRPDVTEVQSLIVNTAAPSPGIRRVTFLTNGTIAPAFVANDEITQNNNGNLAILTIQCSSSWPTTLPGTAA